MSSVLDETLIRSNYVCRFVPRQKTTLSLSLVTVKSGEIDTRFTMVDNLSRIYQEPSEEDEMNSVSQMARFQCFYTSGRAPSLKNPTWQPGRGFPEEKWGA